MTDGLCPSQSVNSPNSLEEKIRAKHTDDPSQDKLPAPKDGSQVQDEVAGVSGQHANADRQECLPCLVSDALFVVVPRCSALIVEEGHFALVGGGGGGGGQREGFCCENEKSRVFSFRFLLSLKAHSPPDARPAPSVCSPSLSPNTHVVSNVFPVQG